MLFTIKDTLAPFLLSLPFSSMWYLILHLHTGSSKGLFPLFLGFLARFCRHDCNVIDRKYPLNVTHQIVWEEVMREIPFSVLVAWPPSNYTDPVTRGPALTIISAVGIGIVATFVFLRLYVRIFMLRWFGADDAFIIIALITAVGMSACSIVAYQDFGWNRHIWDLPLTQFEDALKLAYATKIVYSISACFTRLSLLLYYYRLTNGCSFKWFRYSVHATVVVSIFTGFILVIVDIFQCSPIKAYWTFPAMPNQKCINEGYLTLGCGIANTFADFLVVILPIPLIARLELPRRRRLGAIVLVSLGFIVCIAGIVRAYFTWYSLIATYDETWNAYGVYVSATIEIHLGVICACVPAMRVIVVKIVRPRIRSFMPLSMSSSFGGKSVGYKKSLADLESITQVSSFGGPLSKLGNDPNILSRQSTQYRPPIVEDNLKPKRFGVNSDKCGGNPRTPFREDAVILKEMEVDVKSEYLWDEPWSGTNGPGRNTMHERRVSLAAANEKRDRSSPTGLTRLEADIFVKAKQNSDLSHPYRQSRVDSDIRLLEQEGLGVLPDLAATETSESVHSHPSASANSTISPCQLSLAKDDLDGDESDDSEDVVLPIQGISDSPSGEKRKRTSTLQIPASTLKKSRPPQLDFNFDFEGENRRISNLRLSVPVFSPTRPSTSPSTVGGTSSSSGIAKPTRTHETDSETAKEDSDEKQIKRTSFLNSASQESLSMTPVKRYVRQQHSLLWDVIQKDRLLQLRSSQQTDELRVILQGVRPSSSNV